MLKILDRGEVKSALQKAIRFGRSGEAIAFAIRLYDFDPISLVNRLCIIVAEDVGGDKMADVVDNGKNIISLFRAGDHATAKQIVANVTNSLASAVKTKYCHFGVLGKEKLKDSTLDGWEQKLNRFIDDELPEEAAGFAIMAYEKFGIKPILGVLAKAAYLHGINAVRCIAGYDWRLRQSGTRTCDLEILIGASAATLAKIKKVHYEIECDLDKIDPSYFDVHCRLGKASLSIAARKLPEDPEILWRMQFFLKSALICPASEEHLRLEKMMGPIISRWIKLPLEEAKRRWTVAEPIVEGYTTWLLKNRSGNEKGIRN